MTEAGQSSRARRAMRSAARAVVVVAAIVGLQRVAVGATSAVVAEVVTLSRSADVTQPAKRLNIDVTKPIFPMQTEPMCNVLDNYGDPRSGGTRSHIGTDMMAERGQEVYAVVTGTLIRQTVEGNDSGLAGNAWRLQVDDGETWYAYMHLDGFAPGLEVGSHVTQGQVIGYVGSSGNDSPQNTHLHFEIHPNGGAAVNPLTILTVPDDCNVW